MAFDVLVVNDDGDGVSGATVGISFTSILRGKADEETDSDGHATFDGYDDGEIEVFVNGRSYGTYHYDDGNGITITI
jgi:hypothetical protein